MSVVGKDEQYLMAKYSAEYVAGTFEFVIEKRDQCSTTRSIAYAWRGSSS